MLGTKLKQLRVQRGLNQTDLAKKVGVTQPYVAMLERGTFKNPTLAVLKRLAKALKVKLADLLIIEKGQTMEGYAVTDEWVAANEWVAALFAALGGKIPKKYVGQIADHLPIALYARLELAKLTTRLKEREDTIHHLERKCDLLMVRVRELQDLLDRY